MVDEEALALTEQASASEECLESERFRGAFHIAALRTPQRSEKWDIPTFHYGRPLTAEEIHQTVQETTTSKQK